MKHHLVVFFLFTSMLISFNLNAQQNFFNVPSSEITPKNKIFFQQQFNFIASGLASSTTFNYGIGHNAEIGVNYNGLNLKDYQKLDFSSDLPPFAPFLLLNGQKKLEINHIYAISAGTQIGISTTTPEIKFGNYFYINTTFHNKSERFKGIVGIYYATDSYFGEGSRNYLKNPSLNGFGIQFGMEQRLSKNITFQLDMLTGEHSLSEIVVGGTYYLTQNWILSLGLQVPAFNKAVSNGVVFEITFSPSK